MGLYAPLPSKMTWCRPRSFCRGISDMRRATLLMTRSITGTRIIRFVVSCLSQWLVAEDDTPDATEKLECDGEAATVRCCCIDLGDSTMAS